jgi:hypothetical protein
MTRFGTAILAAICVPVLASRVNTPPQGCYRFDRPLGHSATGDLERHDSTWYTVELRDSGVVARPDLKSPYWRKTYSYSSSWRVSGDTLFVVVSTGLVGWNIALLPENDHFAGRARYLTDVRTKGEEPLFVRVRAWRTTCHPPA